MFTDQNVRSNIWEIIKAPRTDPDPRRCSKYHKILPHKVLTQRGYKDPISMWIDGNVIIKKNPNALLKYLNNADTAVFEYPHRNKNKNNVYYEFCRCLDFFKDDPEKLNAQLNKYKTNGIKSNSGLYMGGIILRRHNTKQAILLAKKWWQEIFNFSVRDQLSFPYVIIKNNIKINMMPYKLFLEYFGFCKLSKNIQIKKIKEEINMLKQCPQYPKSLWRIEVLKRRIKRVKQRGN